MPISKCVGQKTVIHLKNGILHSRNKKGTPTFGTAGIELESIMLSEINQVAKDRYHMISPVGGT